MSTQEFSDEFDVLVNSYRRFKDFDKMEQLDSLEFNEYEKSIYLTKAQEEIVKELYSGRITGESFESSEKVRRELQILVKQINYSNTNGDYPIIINTDNNQLKILEDKFKHVGCKLPEDLLYIVYEQAKIATSKCNSGLIADVYPTTHDEYWRVQNNPFRGPNNRRVLRLDKGDNQVELVSNGTIDEYIIRYIRYPKPIVLDYFPNETINKKFNTPQECELDESLHRMILDRAVRLALLSKNINIKDNGNQ